MEEDQDYTGISAARLEIIFQNLLRFCEKDDERIVFHILHYSKEVPCNARPHFRCVVCREVRHKQMFQGQIICGHCIREGRERRYKRRCRRCDYFFLTSSPRIRLCSDCLNPGFCGMAKHVYKSPQFRWKSGNSAGANDSEGESKYTKQLEDWNQ